MGKHMGPADVRMIEGFARKPGATPDVVLQQVHKVRRHTYRQFCLNALSLSLSLSLAPSLSTSIARIILRL